MNAMQDQTQWKFQQYFSPNRSVHIWNLENALAALQAEVKSLHESARRTGHEFVEQRSEFVALTYERDALKSQVESLKKQCAQTKADSAYTVDNAINDYLNP